MRRTATDRETETKRQKGGAVSEQRGHEEGIHQTVGSECQTSAASLSVPRTCSEAQGAPDKALSAGGVWGVHLLGG